MKTSIIDTIKRIEEIAYSDISYMYAMQSINSINDIKSYMETKTVEIHCTDKSYMILGIHKSYIEIGDLAACDKLTISDINNMIVFLKNIVLKYNKVKFITCDMRVKTSYRLLGYIVKSLSARVVEDNKYYWNNEEMAEIKLRIR